MEILPLKKELYDKAKTLGVKRIVLHFSGGNDEGYLDIELNGADYSESKTLWGEVEEWAYNAYGYSGAGDGTPYGDDITYDLENNKVETQEWYHAVNYGEQYNDTLETR